MLSRWLLAECISQTWHFVMIGMSLSLKIAQCKAAFDLLVFWSGVHVNCIGLGRCSDWLLQFCCCPWLWLGHCLQLIQADFWLCWARLTFISILWNCLQKWLPCLTPHWSLMVCPCVFEDVLDNVNVHWFDTLFFQLFHYVWDFN